jgi:flagellar hook assembly protein FlgD
MMRQQRALRGLIFAAILLGSLAPKAGAVALNIARTEVFSSSNFGTDANNNFCWTVSANPLTFQCKAGNGRPGSGNISNNPRMEFESLSPRAPLGACNSEAAMQANGALQLGEADDNVCNDVLFLCTAIGYTNEQTTAVPVDEIQFEVFKFQDGSNPLDPGSTPPLRTFYIDNDGTLSLAANQTSLAFLPSNGRDLCVMWDGQTNIQGEFGKTNGQYGFRVTAKTQIQNPNTGNITITAIRAFPGGAALDNVGNPVAQKPINIDVTNIHLVRASATVVGQTGVVVQPYNLTYRLSKDSTMHLNITNPTQVIRSVVPGLPRIGEGVPNGTLLNGDSWNGRFNNGDLGPPGVYMATFSAVSIDQFGTDQSFPVIRQIALDPLQITDVRVSPLTAASTSLAVLSFELTEPATAYVDIYPPNTQFCPVGAVTNPLNSINSTALDQAGVLYTVGGVTGVNETGPQSVKNVGARLDNCAGTEIQPLRRIVEQKASRVLSTVFWDGRSKDGFMQPDGNYVFVVYAALPSQNGFNYTGATSDKRIWSSQARSGYVPIQRGLVGISQISPASSVVGSSPSAAGLDPFSFRYSLSRDAIVTMRLFKLEGDVNNVTSASTIPIRTLVDRELRPGAPFTNQERWEVALTSGGATVSSGTYMVQLMAADPLLPSKVSTTTALFPVDLFRITDVNATPLLGGATEFANIFYQLSQTMNVGLNIYPPGTVIYSSATWPPCGSLEPGVCAQTVSPVGVPVGPIVTIKGMKPGRRTLIETWDGRDNSGLFVPDGQYLFTVAAESTTTPKYFASDKQIGSIQVVRGAIVFTSFAVKPDIPKLFNSSNTITLHPFVVEYGVNRQSSVTVQILTTAVPPQVVRNIIAGSVRESGALLQEVWDGRDDKGNFPRSGFYNVRATAQDIASILASGSTAQLTISFDPLRIYDLAITPLRVDSPGVIAYQVSETMKVAVKIYRPGTVFDSSGNPSPAEGQSLVKRIIGIRPARTLVEEVWDGTDLKQSLVPDGIYKFRIVASTDVNAIDSVTGDVRAGASLSLDNPIDDIPVVRTNSATDPIKEFEENSFFYPNPVHGDKATVKIFVPVQAKVTLKIFNIAGQLVFEQDFGEWPTNSCVQDLQCISGISWNKTNNSGKKVARGLYYAVIREEETIGGRNVLQTTKKILIP